MVFLREITVGCGPSKASRRQSPISHRTKLLNAVLYGPASLSVLVCVTSVCIMSFVVERPSTRDVTEASINRGLASAAWRSEGPRASEHGAWGLSLRADERSAGGWAKRVSKRSIRDETWLLKVSDMRKATWCL